MFRISARECDAPVDKSTTAELYTSNLSFWKDIHNTEDAALAKGPGEFFSSTFKRICSILQNICTQEDIKIIPNVCFHLQSDIACTLTEFSGKEFFKCAFLASHIGEKADISKNILDE